MTEKSISDTEIKIKNIEFCSTVICPKCGHSETETMLIDSCQWFYDCKGCAEVLKPKPGDCCIYCSYGSIPCPSIQAEIIANTVTLQKGK